MEADEGPPPPPWKQNKSAAAIESSSGPLASAAARLSIRSRAIPPARDFHFYNNFPSFKSPIGAAAARAESSLGVLGASPLLPKQEQPTFPLEDLDDAYDWLVARNDDLLEMFGASADEFKALREKEEAQGRKVAPDEMAGDGFQVVYGKKKKKIDTGEEGCVGRGEAFGSSGSARMATMDKAATSGTKPKVPFHIPTIPRPQDVYRIVVDNTSKPFQHAFLERSDDGARLVHPLEKLPAEQLFDRRILESEPLKPPALDDTSFTYVEDRKTLEMLAAKLKSATEFAVDLEHNHYRSFQGLTCLMQISTRTEDFIVDTLKLRNYLGENLREVFQDPTKKKVMHGADRDIIWLQRDFGIYVCNLFDTGQASRILRMDRNSLEHLLHHFCGVTANKEYQSADWRLRPLPAEMKKYAREDTHYLLYIYDLMRLRLVNESSSENDLLLEVCKRSNEICLQLYEKEQLTDSSYLYIHGLKENELSARQLAVLATKSKVDKIKSSVVLPFHHFSGGAKPLATSLPVTKSAGPELEIICNDPASQMEEVIQLDTERDDSHLPENDNADGQRQCEPEDAELASSPPELSSGIEQRFRSLNEIRNPQQNERAPEEPEFNDQLKAFDYAEARKNIPFGEMKADRRKNNAVARAINKESGDKRRTSKQPGDKEDEGNFQNPRRRQAFPPSGNRSSTYH
uniref:Uncharacterized protein n=2 Tax=Avena sativa TaxID=4498 RepID=A0ACD5TJW2_AVESA